MASVFLSKWKSVTSAASDSVIGVRSNSISFCYLPFSQIQTLSPFITIFRAPGFGFRHTVQKCEKTIAVSNQSAYRVLAVWWRRFLCKSPRNNHPNGTGRPHGKFGPGPLKTVDVHKVMQFSQSAPADQVPGYAHLPPHRRTTLYQGCARSSASGRSQMRVLPPGTLCPTTSAPWLILSSSENCWNRTILVKLLTPVDFCVFLGVLAFGWLL